MGQFIVGVDTPKVVRDPAAIAIVELLDDVATIRQSRDHAVRDIIAIRALPANLSLEAVVARVAEAAAPLGPWTRVVYDAAGSDTIVRAFRDAQRSGLFASHPIGINITSGDGIGEVEGRWYIGQAELVRSLLEMVRTKGFSFEDGLEGIEDLIREAVRLEAALSPSGKLSLTTRDHADRVIALGLALYPRIHPNHAGRRYIAPRSAGVFETFKAAQATLGHGAQSA
jgi:hypothetical protein